MISLRQFAPDDACIICQRIYPGMELAQAAALVKEWSTCQYEGKNFLMLGIWADTELVGTVSLMEDESGAVWFGIEILPEYRRRGFAYEAGSLAMERAASLGYHAMLSQVRQDNVASIALHEKLGFQRTSSGANRKGRHVYHYRMGLNCR